MKSKAGCFTLSKCPSWPSWQAVWGFQNYKIWNRQFRGCANQRLWMSREPPGKARKIRSFALKIPQLTWLAKALFISTLALIIRRFSQSAPDSLRKQAHVIDKNRQVRVRRFFRMNRKIWKFSCRRFPCVSVDLQILMTFSDTWNKLSLTAQLLPAACKSLSHRRNQIIYWNKR